MKDEDKSKEQLLKELEYQRKLLEGLGISIKDDLEKEEQLSSNKQKVLLVEDNEVFRNFVANILRKNSFDVIEYSEPAEALKFCEEFKDPIDLILSDIVLPGESGIDLVNKIRSIKPEIKVILMSGYSNEILVHPDVYSILNSGEEFLSKPFSMSKLIEKIKTVLG